VAGEHAACGRGECPSWELVAVTIALAGDISRKSTGVTISAKPRPAVA
jgi:hypothetical protein